VDKVFCAAIKDRNGRVWIGFAHPTIIANMVPREDKLGKGDDSVQGFVLNSHDGIFVDRYQALVIAEEAGQIISKYNPKDQLLSEDLRDINDSRQNLVHIKEAVSELTTKEDQWNSLKRTRRTGK